MCIDDSDVMYLNVGEIYEITLTHIHKSFKGDDIVFIDYENKVSTPNGRKLTTAQYLMSRFIPALDCEDFFQTWPTT